MVMDSGVGNEWVTRLSALKKNNRIAKMIRINRMVLPLRSLWAM
jgi:hypothetical protein